MKVTFDTDDIDDALIFNNEDEWEHHVNNLGSYSPREAPESDPEKFPCIALHAGRSNNGYGPDDIHYAFIYPQN